MIEEMSKILNTRKFVKYFFFQRFHNSRHLKILIICEIDFFPNYFRFSNLTNCWKLQKFFSKFSIYENGKIKIFRILDIKQIYILHKSRSNIAVNICKFDFPDQMNTLPGKFDFSSNLWFYIKLLIFSPKMKCKWNPWFFIKYLILHQNFIFQ